MSALSGKSAVVTGAGSGFGRGIAEAFAANGARIVIMDINAEAAEEVALRIGDQALAVTVDITNEESLTGAFQSAEDWSGGIDVVVNNAGMGLQPTPLEDVSRDDFDRVTALNMRSLYDISRIVVPLFKSRGGGNILNIASTAGVSPRPNLTWYNASKGWVITATRSMAVELAPHNIRVNALNPVAGETPMLTTFMGEDTPEMRDKFLATIPLGRFSTPEDIAQAAVFLCSDAASMITGVALEVDGGRCI